MPANLLTPPCPPAILSPVPCLPEQWCTHISPIAPTVGAEVTGVDLASLNPEAESAIQAAFLKHHVLVFRDQSLTRDQHKAFGRLFGELHIHPSKRNGMNQQDPELFIVNTKPDAKLTNGEAWHSDVSCEEIPPKASILYVTKCPENGGGDTLFANMHAAFDELSPDLQTLLLNKTAYHDGEIDLRNYGIRLRDGQTYPKASHPLVPGIQKTAAPTYLPTAALPRTSRALNGGKAICCCRACISAPPTIRAFSAE